MWIVAERKGEGKGEEKVKKGVVVSSCDILSGTQGPGEGHG